ncbi:hypothetical protein RISK_003486 [Rhodopirellula islandica]|uniref:Uncharacterized protein n=1 Tax=Rhodopirellula islandica TaxID=595434 RepID=A0A0J1BCW2_RHOIS|nr:hypothetical protein RISK_003486 [Rhodopirellula islandica]
MPEGLPSMEAVRWAMKSRGEGGHGSREIAISQKQLWADQ